jgi:RNA polymerase sigma factor (sigma-70 family)
LSTTDEKAPPAPSSPAAARLLETYLARQDELRGFYRARLGPQADIEDLVQDLYVKIRGLEDQEVRNAPAFLYRLAHNHMLDWLRRGRRSRIRDDAWRQASHTASGRVDVADDPDAETTLIARQRLERIGLALRALPPRTQEIFRLHKIEGLSYAETAQRLGLAKKSIEKHMSAALAHLYAKVGR